MHNFSIESAASRSCSGATTASTAPSFSAASAFLSAPAQIHSTALSTPMMRGMRTDPPKPGKMPSFTSGKPTDAAVDITR